MRRLALEIMKKCAGDMLQPQLKILMNKILD